MAPRQRPRPHPSDARPSLAARVPLDRGEATRQALREAGALRLDLRPRAEGASLLIPVAEAARGQFPDLAFEEAAFEPQAAPPPRWQDLARVPPSLKALLPSSFDVVGAVVVVKLPPELEPHAGEVGRALLEALPAARTVLLDRGVRGRDRVRQVVVAAGEPTTVAEHVEHGARLRCDLATAYFSPRLATEHARVAALARPGEVALDLFAGVGPFAILLARTGKPQRVYAVDANPEAVRWIAENARLNKVEDRVRPVLADADAFARSVAGQCDRVIMNLPQSADAHWEAALGASRPGAAVHYHRIVERGQEQAHAAALAERAAAAGWRARLLGTRDVRTYSPTQDHVAFDFQVER